MTPGQIIRLRGKTLKGKNRIRRGGDEWRVAHVHRIGNWPLPRGLASHRVLVASRIEGAREMFWIDLPDDPHVAVIEPSATSPAKGGGESN